MPFVRYSKAQQAEAVALAVVLGLSAASDQLGIPEDTVSSWMRKAGKSPADAIDPPSWKRVADLALAKAERMVAEGKMSAAQLLNVVTMAQKGAASEARTKPSDSAVTARDAFVESEPDAPVAILRELLRRANAEPDQPHRAAMLAWFSDDPDTPAGDVLAWAQGQTEAIRATHGTLDAWDDWHAAVQARDEVIGARAHVLSREGGLRPFEAQAFAAEHLADDLPVPQIGAHR
jgi:hypothetical protein